MHVHIWTRLLDEIVVSHIFGWGDLSRGFCFRRVTIIFAAFSLSSKLSPIIFTSYTFAFFPQYRIAYIMAKVEDTQNGETTTTITATTHLTLPVHPIPLSHDQLNPLSSPTEFLGVIGTSGISIIASFTVYFLFYACNEATGCPATNKEGWTTMLEGVRQWPSSAGRLWEWKAFAAYLAWYAYCIVCWAVLPGEKVDGNLLRDGNRKVLKTNGAKSVPSRTRRCND